MRHIGDVLRTIIANAPSNVRARLSVEYKADHRGFIRTPGKFEGNRIYVPFFWTLGVDGCADHDDGEAFYFRVDSSDVDIFPELYGVYQIVLWDDRDGFVHCKEIRNDR